MCVRERLELVTAELLCSINQIMFGNSNITAKSPWPLAVFVFQWKLYKLTAPVESVGCIVVWTCTLCCYGIPWNTLLYAVLLCLIISSCVICICLIVVRVCTLRPLCFILMQYCQANTKVPLLALKVIFSHEFIYLNLILCVHWHLMHFSLWSFCCNLDC